MAQYELVREIPNLCRNNQMRDVFFTEVETQDPEEYVRTFLRGKVLSLSREQNADGSVTVPEVLRKYVGCDIIKK